MPSGNQDPAEIRKEGYYKEMVGVFWLEESGYKIIQGAGMLHPEGLKYFLRLQNEHDYIISLQKKLGIRTKSNFGYFDCLCKKDNQYFLFEIKYKIWKEGRMIFGSTERQISEYDRIQKIGKVKVKVLTIIEKDQEDSFHIYDWDDFEKTKNALKLRI